MKSMSTLQTLFHSQFQYYLFSRLLRPSTPEVHSPLTSVLVIVYDVFQILQEEVTPGLLKFTLLLPVLHSFHLSPWAQGLSLSTFTIIVEEGLVIEESSGLKAGEALSRSRHSCVEVAQSVRPCKKGGDIKV